MNSFKNLIISLLTGAIASACAFAATGLDPVRHQEIIDSVKLELSKVHTPADSIPLLFDLYDLAPYSNRFNTADSVYQTAVRAGDVKVQMEMCYRMADIAMTMADPELTSSMLDRLEKLPDSPEKEITRCYIKTCIAPARKFSSEEELASEIRRLLAEINDDDDDDDDEKKMSIYDRIARMFNLADYLQGYTQGTYLTEFMDRLEAEIARVPHDKGAILRNKFYATAAMMYMRNEQFEKAIKADRKLLAVIDRIEESNNDSGRKFRDFTIYRFVSYRRMLKGYSSLSEEETQALYDKIMELAKINPDVRDDIEVMPLPEMALHLKKGDYEAALPYLETLVDNSGSLYEKKYYLRRLKAAADSTGNQELLKRAAVEYSDILEKYTDLKTAERLRELQINYDYESLRHSNAEELKRREKTVTILAIVASALLIIVVIAFILMTARLTAGKRKLARANEQLHNEGEELRKATESLTAERNRTARAVTEKTQLVNYVTNEVLNPINAIVEYSQMIVDNAQGDNKKYLERFKSIVSMNTKLLQGLMADVQELAVAESGKLPINFAPVDLNALARKVLDSIKPQVAAGVDVRYIPANREEKFIYNTDSRRVEIILLNLLSNAAKFTSKGSITLALEKDNQSGDAIFSVTDTGIGVPADKAEVIFHRFEKLNPDIEGSGLGLSVCKLVARAIEATVRLDTTYPGPGARFLFILHPRS